MDLVERFENVLKKLSEEENPMAVEMCKLGYPSESKIIPTACVMWDDTRKKVNFLFNPKFEKKLNDEEFAFIIAHECIHLLNGHILLLKDILDEMIRFKKTDKEIVKFKRKFNIAADCVVNDSLVNLYGFNPIMTEIEPTTGKSKIVYGKQWVGEDCHDLTAMEVFYMLKDEDIDKFSGNIDEHSWESFFDSNGELKDSVAKSIKDFIERNIENSSLSDEDISKIEQIKKNFENYIPKGSKAGSMKIGQYRAVDNLSKVAVNWNRIFFQLTERKKPENIWHKPNRKLISVYPDVILPSLANEEKEDIFVAIDASGSIDYNALNLFVSVIKNVPKSFNVRAISFDTSCYEYDLKQDKRPKGGGGTNFQIIEDWIQANIKKYPKIVIVLTDGEGTHVYPKHPERWCFMLYGSSSRAYCRDMKNFNIKDLLI